MNVFQRGANPNAQDTDGYTALHIAARDGNYGSASALLRCEASLHIRDKTGKTAIDVASECGKHQVLKVCLQEPEAKTVLEKFYDSKDNKRVLTTCLHLAAANGHIECMKLLLQFGFDVNKQSVVGTALHDAATCGKLQAVQLLVESGIDVFKANDMNETALDRVNRLVGSRGNRDIKEYLFKCMTSLKVKVNRSYDAIPNTSHLKLEVGDVVTVTEQNENGLWKGTLGKSSGYFPKDHVEIIPMRNLSKSPESSRIGKQDGRFSSPLRPTTSTPNGSILDVNSVKRPSSDGANGKAQHIPEQIAPQALDFNRFKMVSGGVHKSSIAISDLPNIEISSSENSEVITEEANRILQSLSQPNSSYSHEMHVLQKWFKHINLEGYAKTLVEAGYDSYTASHMSGADLAAVGVTNPAHRQAISEILHGKMMEVEPLLVPRYPETVEEFLRSINLTQYLDIFTRSGFTSVSELLKVSMEDLMEMGIEKFGHQKRIVVYLTKLKNINSQKAAAHEDEISSATDECLDKLSPVQEKSVMDSFELRMSRIPPQIFIPTEKDSPSRSTAPWFSKMDQNMNEQLTRIRKSSPPVPFKDRPVSSNIIFSKDLKTPVNEGDIISRSYGSNDTLKDDSFEHTDSPSSSGGKRSPVMPGFSHSPMSSDNSDVFQNISVYPGHSLKRSQKPKYNGAHVSIDPITSQPVMKSPSSSPKPNQRPHLGTVPVRTYPVMLPPPLNPRPVPLSTFAPPTPNSLASPFYRSEVPQTGLQKSPSSLRCSQSSLTESEDPYIQLPPPLHVKSSSLGNSRRPPGDLEFPAPSESLLIDTPTDSPDEKDEFSFTSGSPTESATPPSVPKRIGSLTAKSVKDSAQFTSLHPNYHQMNQHSPRIDFSSRPR